MVATVIVNEKNGAGETATDKTSGTIRYKNADNATVDANDPMVIPGAGSDFSFDKWLQLEVTVAPDTQLDNLEVYTDGASGFGTGVLAWYKITGSYSTPSAPASAAGYTDLFALTSGSPGDLGAGPHTSTGDKGSYLQTMLEVASTATQGALTAETLTFAYDES
jgi:hypothetical protein